LPESEQSYQAQLDQKVAHCQSLLAPFKAPTPETFKSQEMGYRQRCELHIFRQDDRLNYAMLRPGTKERYIISNFQAGAPAIQITMPKLLEALNRSKVLAEKLFRVDFLSSLSGELCITLVYHRSLDSNWELEAELVRQRLGCRLIGRSRKQKVTLGGDYVTEQLAIHGKVFKTRQIEGSFTQPNALVNREMLEWAVESAEGIGGDLLELYCGNGNFTLPLSRKFDKVLATEISKTSIAALEWGMQENQVENIVCARLSAAEACSAIKRERPFRRLEHIDLDSYQFSTLFVDPPRAGLDEQTLEWASSFDHVIYVSCNPETLAQNLEEFCKTHRIERFACFDQFPFTPHLEVGVKLVRK
jgi:tRNA (uracil-5-)-methyltransferase